MASAVSSARPPVQTRTLDVSSTSTRRAALGLLVLLCVMVGAAGTWIYLERDYYLRPLVEQAQHPEHARLRSAGSVGLWLGIAGTSCIVVNLLYLARRVWLRGAMLGSLRLWMHLHVVSGLAAGGLLLVHSALSLRSVAGTLAGTAIAVVVITGVLGRFVHALVPRTLEGREQDFEDVKQSFRHLRERLAADGVELAFPPLPQPDPPRSALRAVSNLLRRAPVLRRERREIRASLSLEELPKDVHEEVEGLLVDLFRQRRSLAQFHDLRRLMHSWRFLHRWLALVMVGAAAVHIAVALRYGDLWGR